MIEINLLPEEQKLKQKSHGISASNFKIERKYLIYSLPVLIGILVLLHIYFTVAVITRKNQLNSLNAKWKTMEPQIKQLEASSREYSLLTESAKEAQKLTQGRINWAQKLNKLSLKLPPGIWFNKLTVSPKDVVLEGSVVSLQKEEMDLIKKFIDALKDDNDFMRGFNNLEISSILKRQVGGYEITDFVLVGNIKSK